MGSGKLKAPTTKGKGGAASKKKAAFAEEEEQDEEGEEQDDDDELMAGAEDGHDDENDDGEEAVEEGETVFVAETQFEAPSTKGKTGSRKAPAVKKPSAVASKKVGKGKAAPAVEDDEDEGDDFETSVAAAVGGDFEEVKQSAREKKLQAQLVAVRLPFPISLPLFSHEMYDGTDFNTVILAFENSRRKPSPTSRRRLTSSRTCGLHGQRKLSCG
jgi:hypothetical protein